MAFANSGTITPTALKIGGGVLVGGMVTGMLLAMAMPTQMKRKAETWRDLIGIHETISHDSAIPVYAPPQDLTPVQWQTAAQEYPPLPDHGAALDAIYPDADAGYQADSQPEPLQPELPQTNDSDLAEVDDDAASSAQAASAAADDVQAQVQVPDGTNSAPVTVAAPAPTDAA